MRSMTCLVAVMLVTAIVLSGQAPSRDPAASPACSYLSRDDAAATLGETVTGPKAVSMASALSKSVERLGHGEVGACSVIRPPSRIDRHRTTMRRPSSAPGCRSVGWTILVPSLVLWEIARPRVGRSGAYHA